MNLKSSWILLLACIFLFSCRKESIDPQKPEPLKTEETENLFYSRNNQAENPASEAVTGYTTYVIRKGQHYSNIRPLKSVRTSEMKFYAKFNHTAIYQAIDPDNQYDIHKLWGFSEGFNNQYNSARIGWRYSDEALRLFGYVYVRGVLHYNEITTFIPGEDIYCSIKVSGNNYIITAKGVSITLPRGTTNMIASGLQQYPYFGGDEVAPHDIYIYVKPV